MLNNSICLNMIVKNEEHVIKDTLENLCKYILFSYYVISDTGSTDNTKQIIKDFFESKNIKGEIYDDEWHDFGYNRSLALKYAYNKTKYVFIFDADDRINGNFVLPINLTHESYFLKFGTGITYKRILLVDNTLEWNFIGVLHEYINCLTKKNTSITLIDGDYYVNSGKSGARSNDPDKYKKDAIVLENAFYKAEQENNHLKVRYSFYCAQSYRDANDKINAIKWYKKRIELKDWEQEVYFSYFMVGRLYYDLGEFEKAIYYWSLSYEVDKDRYECIYEIISHFRKNGNSYLAYQYYNMINTSPIDLNEKLFTFFPIYNFLLNYEMINIFFSIKKYQEGINIYKKLFIANNMPLDLMINILETFTLYLDHIVFDLELNEYFLNFINKIYLYTNGFSNKHVNIINNVVDKFKLLSNDFNLEFIKTNLKNCSGNTFLSITTCKRYDLFTKTINSFLLNCKDVKKINYFFCVDDNSSKEDRQNMLKNYPFFKYYFKKENEKGHLASMNIIWEKLNKMNPKYWIHLEDDWLFIKPCNYVQKSIDFLEKYKKDNIHQILFNKNYGEIIENYNLVGGSKLDGNDYILHIKDEQNLNGRNCSYWPHYSFRPSMCLTSTILKLGNYTSSNTFFEMDYANKYNNNNYKSAFYNEITSIHIGKLTSDKSSDVPNAYSLNAVNQFADSYKYVYIDNNIPFSVSNTLAKKLFITSRNILKHYNIWKQLAEINATYFIIMYNTDKSGIHNLNKLINKKYDIILLNSDQELTNPSNYTYTLNELITINTNSYIIQKSFIDKLLDYININGVNTNNLIKLFLMIDNINMCQTNDIIDICHHIDENDNIIINKDDDYIFIQNKDHYGDDIAFIGGKSLEDIMIQTDLITDAVAFNSLGYIKNKVNMETLINYNYKDTEKGGLYIKKLSS